MCKLFVSGSFAQSRRLQDSCQYVGRHQITGCLQLSSQGHSRTLSRFVWFTKEMAISSTLVLCFAVLENGVSCETPLSLESAKLKLLYTANESQTNR